MEHGEVLERALNQTLIDLRYCLENCDETERSFHLGRISGMEIALSLISAFQREVSPTEELNPPVAEKRTPFC